jgi:hypothetical protein
MQDCNVLGTYIRDQIHEMKQHDKYPNVIIASMVEDYESGEAPCCKDCESRELCFPDED